MIPRSGCVAQALYVLVLAGLVGALVHGGTRSDRTPKSRVPTPAVFGVFCRPGPGCPSYEHCAR